jgi:two-component system, chemotaxis family, protein-glutamate methylesterase/glutaminase
MRVLSARRQRQDGSERTPVQNRDIVVVGASAGGVDALTQLVRSLTEDLPAAIFVVLHVGASSRIAEILERAGSMPVSQATSGEAVAPGRVRVAPPGSHLLLHEGHVLLRRGPRENLARPAIDPLFRSAACTYGGRVIGAVLTGSLNDGTAGLRAIKRCGGIAVVQDPEEAAVPDMPRSALQHVAIDFTVPVAGMGELLRRLTSEAAGPTPEIPADIRLEAAIAAQEPASMQKDDQLGSPSAFTCPECHGALWEINDGDILRYRCHVGHAHTAEVILNAKDEEGENHLWAVLRSHQERAELARRMASRQGGRLAAELEKRAEDYDEAAGVLRQILTRVSLPQY